MTKEQILKKAIEKAVKNGYKEEYHMGEFWNSWEYWSEEYKQGMIQAIIFSHDFAKAFWKRDKDSLLPEGKSWVYHLQQLALAENRLAYLEKFL